MKGIRHPCITAKPIQSGATIDARLMPIWFKAAPRARSEGLRYIPFNFPTAGIPADSPIANADLVSNKPPKPCVIAVVKAAVDHQATAAQMLRVTPNRSKIQPAAKLATA